MSKSKGIIIDYLPGSSLTKSSYLTDQNLLTISGSRDHILEVMCHELAHVRLRHIFVNTPYRVFRQELEAWDTAWGRSLDPFCPNFVFRALRSYTTSVKGIKTRQNMFRAMNRLLKKFAHKSRQHKCFDIT